VGAGEGQLWAQLTGLVALGAWGLLWGTVLGLLANPGRIKHVLSHTSHPRVARSVSSGAADASEARVTQPESDDVLIVDEQERGPSNGAEPAIPECEPEPEPETGSRYGSDELQG
jgi:hypothetical protein